MNYPPQVTLIEVGPRDGLQNEPSFVPTVKKIEWINQLSRSGLKHIEVTSFVSSKAVPQLRDHDEVLKAIDKPKDVHFSALVPNEQGMHNAVAVGLKNIALFTAASESFNQHNIHCSIEESIERAKPVLVLARQHQMHVRAYISCVLGCPYEGSIRPQQVVDVMLKLLKLGVDEVSFGDTIGVGTPKQTQALIKAILPHLSPTLMAMHFHDTYGQAIANTYAALEAGIARFDSSVAGLGGCPYAPNSSGNVATEDMLYLMHGLGIKTGVDIYQIVTAGDMMCKILGRSNQSKVAKALLGRGGSAING